MGVVADLAPVDDADHERIAAAAQDEAVREQRILDLLRRRDASAHERMAQRHGDLGTERTQCQFRRRRGGVGEGGGRGGEGGEGLASGRRSRHLGFLWWWLGISYPATRHGGETMTEA